MHPREGERGGGVPSRGGCARLPLLAAMLVAVSSGRPATAQVIIHEIHYHPRSDLQEDEFIELRNLGPAAVDLSGWTFTRGVSFQFPPGTSIPPDGYLVVAGNAEKIRRTHGLPESLVVGDWTGALSNRGEYVELRDARGSFVNGVGYADEYPWPAAADGGGPSLEVIDPRRDNSSPRNWAASENRGWIEATVRGIAKSSRLHLYLESAGECLIDDLRLLDDATGTNLLPDGDFESGAPGWQMTGTHAGSGVTTEDRHGGSASLKIAATGPGSTAETSVWKDVPGLVAGTACTIAFWAKPVSGGSSLVSRIASGGPIGRTQLRLLEGTPGRANASRGENLPPLVQMAWTEPRLPRPRETVTLLAVVEDEDLAEVVATWDVGSTPVELVLRDDGRSGDGVAGDGLFGGSIPGAPLGTIVEYRIRAVDLAGQRTETPPERYPVADPPPASNLPVYSIFIREADWARLNANIWTTEYFPAVVVYEGEIWPDAGLRFRGGRPRLFRKKSLKLEFPARRLFEGREEVNLNAAAMDDDYLTEPLAYWFYERAGIPASATRFVRVELNGAFWGLFIDVEQVDERYLSRHALDPRGALYKAVGIVGSLRKLDGVLYQGQEYTYQSQYEKKTRREEPYDDLIALVHGLYETPPSQMEAFLSENVDVEGYVNYLAATDLMCVWDAIQHNYYLFRDTEGDGRWRVIPWDLDHAWGEWEWNYYYADTFHLFMGTESHPFAGVWYTWNKLWTELLKVPKFRSMYIARIRELLNTLFAEGPLFRKIDQIVAEIRPTVLLDEAKWPDSLEPQHTGPKRTMDQEIPILKDTISRRRRYMAQVVGVELVDVPAGTLFRRGDANGDGSVDVADAVAILRTLYFQGSGFPCADAADANDDGSANISDAVFALRYLFLAGPAPPAPGPGACGDDPTEDAIGCDLNFCK